MRGSKSIRIVCLTLVFVLLFAQSAFGVGHIAGMLHHSDGTPLAGGIAQVCDTSGVWVTTGVSANDGRYSAAVAPGDYKVITTVDSWDFGWGWMSSTAPYGLVPLRSMGDTITIGGDETHTADATVPAAASIQGTVTVAATGAGLGGVRVQPYCLSTTTGLWEPISWNATSSPSGAYVVRWLLPGTYRIGFSDSGHVYPDQYWNTRPDILSADDVAVGVGASLTGYGAAMGASAVQVTSETVAGPGRIDTAIDAAKKMYPDATTHADAVIITNGYNWPDALGGSALAGVMNAPVLLNAAPPAGMPQRLDDEVARLKANGAADAYILGDTSAVSDAVATRLATIFGGADKVHRLGATGRSRYATSLDIANAVKTKAGAAWGGTVFLAKGTDYPDALVAAPLAAKKGWPIVLAEDDGHGGLSARVKAFLQSNATSKVIVLGSTSAVPKSVADSAGSAVGAGKVDRWWGADRIGTAIDVADHSVANGMSYGGIGIATGYVFADALCGGPYLAKQNNPLLLTTNALPLAQALDTKLKSLSPTVQTVRFLGSTAAVSQPVRDAITQDLK